MIAFFIYSNQLFYAKADEAQLSGSPVVRLIESVWDHYPDQAFHLLRSRIFTNYPLTPLCKATIKLAAKRASELPQKNLEEVWGLSIPKLELIPAQKIAPAVVLPELESETALINWMRHYSFDGKNRPILALLVERHNDSLKPILATLNTSAQNRLLHAEVNLAREYERLYQRKIPKNGEIWVSLKPCCMCGTFLSNHSELGEKVPVYYLEDDPGPKARTSPLLNQHQVSHKN